jgi:hypothetical protein
MGKKPHSNPDSRIGQLPSEVREIDFASDDESVDDTRLIVLIRMVYAALMCGVVARPAEYDAVIQGRQSPLVDVFAVMGMRTFGILVLHLRRVAKGKNDRATARAPIFLTSKGQFLSYEGELIGSGHLRSSSIASLLRALQTLLRPREVYKNSRWRQEVVALPTVGYFHSK